MLARRVPRRFPPAPFPPEDGARLRGALGAAHADRPFSPREVRIAASTVARVATDLGMQALLVRGGVDVGGAELDHVWAVVEGRVVDVALPLRSEAFVRSLRAYIAGDLDEDALDHVAHGYAMDWRVVGEYPSRHRYVGLPVWSERSRS